jgi:type I restriction enzyme, S subunit
VTTQTPPGWDLVTVADVAEVQGGIQKQQSRRPIRNKYPFLRVANVERGRLNLQEIHEVELFEGELERLALQPGDLLVVEGNGSPDQIGRSAMWSGEIAHCVHQNHLIRVRPKSVLIPRFLELLWNSPDVAGRLRQVANSTSGLHTLSTSKIKAINLAIPPLDEQRQIATVLDQVELLCKKRREAIALLDDLAQSIFSDMFGDIHNPSKPWSTTQLGNVANFYAGASLPPGDSYSGQIGGYFMLKVSDMNLPGNETLLTSCQNWTPTTGTKSATCPPGTIVIPKRGAAIATNKKRITLRPSILDPNLMGIHPKPNLIDLPYLYHWFTKFDLNGITSGSSVPQLNKQDLTPLVIQVPPMALQKEFAARISQLEVVKTSQNIHLAELDALFSSLQHRAFRGELWDSAAS